MKKILLVFLLFFSIIISAQDLSYESVIKVDSLVSKDELYNRARTWAKENYNSKNNVIITEDRINGEISCTGSFDYRTNNKYQGYTCVEGPIKYNLTIYVKDGRYKYVFNAFDHKGSSGNLCRAGDFGRMKVGNDAPSIGKGIAFDKGWEDVKIKINEKILLLISNLENGMNKKYEANNDW